MDVQKMLLALNDEVNGEKATKVLHVASYFAPADIEISLLLDLLAGPDDLRNAVELLKRRSLVQSGSKASSIRIGKQVQVEVQRCLKQQGKEENVLKMAIALLGKHLSPKSPSAYDHAMAVFEVAKVYPDLVKRNSMFPNDIIQGLLKQDRDLEASTFGTEALEVLKKSLGGYSHATHSLQKALGLSLLCVEKVGEGLAMLSDVYLRQSEAKGRKEVDKNLTLIAKTMSDLTSEPESRVRRLVFGEATPSGTNNNTTLDLWKTYAMMLSELKWADAALPILEEVLEKRRQLLDPDDDAICDVQDSIARVHLNRKDFPKALEVFRRVYEQRKRVFGENCLMTFLSQREVAHVYNSMGMLDEAMAEYELVAEKVRRIVGDDDTIYLSTLGKIAFILYRQKKYEKSYALYTEIYDDYVKVLGQKDLQTLHIKHNMGSILVDQGKMKEGMSAWREVLEGYFEVLGPKHPESVDLMNKLFLLTLRVNA